VATTARTAIVNDVAAAEGHERADHDAFKVKAIT
jgi:hypothetical protein